MVFDMLWGGRDAAPPGVPPDTPEAAGSTSNPLASMDYATGSAALAPEGAAPEPAVQLPEVTPGEWRNVDDIDVNSKIMKKYAADESQAKDQQVKTWGRIADFVGVHLTMLGDFNPGLDMSASAAPAAGAMLYVPSASELLFWQTAVDGGFDLSATEVRDNLAGAAAKAQPAVAEYAQLKSEGRVDVVGAARDRTAGETGDAYAYFSGRFYTENSGLQVRSKKETADGESQHVAAWGKSWKCNVFVQDSMHSGGQDTPIMGNKHYATAGMMYKNHTEKLGDPANGNRMYKEVEYGDIKAGDMFVRYGGTGEASSHTEVITRRMSAACFFATGAHGEGAYERQYYTDRDALDARKLEVVKAHLKTLGEDPEAMNEEELAAAVSTHGYELMNAAHTQFLDTSSYHFLRHKKMM